MSVVIVYKKTKCVFHENTDRWSARDGELEAKSLTELKALIDKLSKIDRRVSVPALILEDNYYRSNDKKSVAEVTVTIICEPDAQRYSRRNEDSNECWVVGSDKRRYKVRIDELYPLEALSELKTYIELHTAARAADKVAEKYMADMCPFDAKSLREAMKE